MKLKKFAPAGFIAIAVAIGTAGCSSGPARDARSYDAGHQVGQTLALKMVRAGVSSSQACKAQTEAANVWNPNPYNLTDFNAGCLDGIHAAAPGE
ncbi:hypothetical protein A5760_19700 [Mycobacterium colombiense]|uniref:Uncharacterized protein n=1 Tax=Mycobacterium colombiense TaxID=339268 RepID=A0A1A0VAP8_9MYCO|nr:hypothetical protein [Mycobacterium colombiense]OBB80313.1 hypothetical protein A5760_19700 [Mycobacterium colombiense]